MSAAKEVSMSLNDFVKELQNRYKGYVGINHVDMDVDEAQHCEGDGDFIYEDHFVVIGKYIHSLNLFKPSGECETVKFCAYGIGVKEYTAIDDYELASYENFEYLFV